MHPEMTYTSTLVVLSTRTGDRAPNMTIRSAVDTVMKMTFVYFVFFTKRVWAGESHVVGGASPLS